MHRSAVVTETEIIL